LTTFDKSHAVTQKRQPTYVKQTDGQTYMMTVS